MAINPFRIGQLEIPANPQQRPIDWSGAERGLSALGEGLGRYREQQQLGEIMAGAVDPATGELDWNKAAKAIAISGRDPTKVLSQLTARESLARQEAAQRSTETYQRTQEELARARLAEEARANAAREAQSRRQWIAPVPGTLMEPERPGGVIELGPPGQAPTWHPVQRPPAPAGPPPTPPPGPQSEVAPGVLPPSAGPTAAFNPEQAPPYQVAGPPTAPPAAPGAAPAAPTPVLPPRKDPKRADYARDENILARLPTDEARTIVKGVAEYQIDPDKYEAKTRERIITAAKQYRPDYETSEYQKRTTPLSPEASARIGLAKVFIGKVPAIRERLQSNELNSWEGAATALWGTGGPGQLRRVIDQGSDALLRTLTGAGMNKEEATDYARRYRFSVRDDKANAISKLDELDEALRYVSTEMNAGRGGEDLLKGFVSTFSKPVVPEKEKKGKGTPKIENDEQANLRIEHAREALKNKWQTYDFLIKDLRKAGVRNPELFLQRGE